ncbi:hypothetical protein [Mycolicibacterium iranicum]|uniref:Uncharacterized protein n=1 Tax=Mycolicibacterium iranicum TaxID=912594 RepID=A0A178M0Y3_MYCIR|nr:hypothetical protein [Mycolicibacterium iranicum]OAN40839.1 hypothetical protein A4X20_30590 [Mycolicibacterium iranicum]
MSNHPNQAAVNNASPVHYLWPCLFIAAALWNVAHVVTGLVATGEFNWDKAVIAVLFFAIAKLNLTILWLRRRHSTAGPAVVNENRP